MTFLIDENLSRRLKGLLRSTFPGCIHVSDVHLLEADDIDVWRHAQTAGFALLSKDDDLRLLVERHGPPPKLVWLRLGNCSTADIVSALNAEANAIAAFLKQDQDGVLTITP